MYYTVGMDLAKHWLALDIEEGIYHRANIARMAILDAGFDCIWDSWWAQGTFIGDANNDKDYFDAVEFMHTGKACGRPIYWSHKKAVMWIRGMTWGQRRILLRILTEIR